MMAKVLNFRQGRHTQTTNQMLLSVKDVSSRESAAALVGKSVVIRTASGKAIRGKVTSPHGNGGILRARFRRGVPASVLGKDAEIAA